MEINPKVGGTAGEIWNLLNDQGPQTFSELKKKLGETSEMIGFALGWLAREDKVEISQDKKKLKVALK